MQTGKIIITSNFYLLTNSTKATATDDEVKAARYIAKKFRQLGLLPMGSDGYYYPFHYKVDKNPKDSMLHQNQTLA